MAENDDRNLPTDGPRHIGQIIRQETHFQGPLPPPEAFAAYERVLHGAADRILTLAENQASHRQKLEGRALTGDLIKAMTQTIRTIKLYHRQVYGFAYHRTKLDLLRSGMLDDKRQGDRRFASLADFLESIPTTCPHDLFRRDDDPKARASQAAPP